MKGLILSAMNKREEALELARKGLSKNFRSGTCWHVYGLVLRAEKKYEEAIKVKFYLCLIRTFYQGLFKCCKMGKSQSAHPEGPESSTDPDARL